MDTYVNYNCDCCGKEFEIKISRYNRKINGKQKHIVCSKECKSKMQSITMSGENNKKYNKVTKICLNCGEEYKTDKCKEDSSKFCCRECKDKYNAKKAIIHIFCEYCGKEIVTLKGKVNRGKRFCSDECSKKSRETKVTKVCEICKKEYKTHKRRSESSHTCSKKCHNKWLSIYSQQEEVKNRLRKQGTKTSSQQKTEFTKPELIVCEYFQNININFIPQFIINDILIADFFLPDFNCIFEVYGDYWHSNPKFYGDGEGLKPLNDTQKKIRQKDIRRYKVIKNKLGYNFYSIWEDDIYNNLNNIMEGIF